MTSATRARIAGLAGKRRQLLAELETCELELRHASTDVVREGEPAKPVAELAGVSRETLYKWLRSSGVATDTLALERRLEARIAVLEAKHARRVADKLGELEPAGDRSRRGNWRSGYQIEAMGRRTGFETSARAVYELAAELELEATELDAELDEARAELESIRDARLAF